MATLAPQTITAPGLAPAYTAVSGGGDKLQPGKGTFLHVKNGSGASTVVTITTPGTVNGLAIADRTVNVAAGADKMIPIPAAEYGDPADNGLASFLCAPTTSVTAAALRI